MLSIPSRSTVFTDKPLTLGYIETITFYCVYKMLALVVFCYENELTNLHVIFRSHSLNANGKCTQLSICTQHRFIYRLD